MYDSNDFVKVIKRVAMEAVNAAKPANIVFGTVVNESPLQVKVDQKLVLNTAQLVLSRNVTDYEIEIEPSEEPKKKHKVYNALKNGETVILFQVAGGQKFIIIDRVGKGDDQ